MEKLIQLLNEREKELSPSIQVERTEFSVWINKWYLISKEFWFIKWLFDKDKIDWSKFHKYSFYKKDNKFIQYYDWQSLLMALSISNTPIDDLVSYLR